MVNFYILPILEESSNSGVLMCVFFEIWIIGAFTHISWILAPNTEDCCHTCICSLGTKYKLCVG